MRKLLYTSSRTKSRWREEEGGDEGEGECKSQSKDAVDPVWIQCCRSGGGDDGGAIVLLAAVAGKHKNGSPFRRQCSA